MLVDCLYIILKSEIMYKAHDQCQELLLKNISIFMKTLIIHIHFDEE